MVKKYDRDSLDVLLFFEIIRKQNMGKILMMLTKDITNKMIFKEIFEDCWSQSTEIAIECWRMASVICLKKHKVSFSY